MENNKIAQLNTTDLYEELIQRLVATVVTPGLHTQMKWIIIRDLIDAKIEAEEYIVKHPEMDCRGFDDAEDSVGIYLTPADFYGWYLDNLHDGMYDEDNCDHAFDENDFKPFCQIYNLTFDF